MTGPRLFARTHLLALAALMLLPACSPRKPIPSDPAEVRTEAQVRGAARATTQPVTAPEPQAAPEAKAVVVTEPKAIMADMKSAETKPDVLVARVSAETKPTQDASAKAMPTETEPAAALPAPVTTKLDSTSTLAADMKAEPPKALEPKVVEAKAVEVTKKAAAPDADKTSKVAQDTKTIISEVTASAEASAQPEKEVPLEAANDAARPAIVQIASFSTEKNAQSALSWLKDKGYSESRVVRVEQGLTVYHRVQAGPFQDLDAARKALEELKATWPQAFIPAD